MTHSIVLLEYFFFYFGAFFLCVIGVCALVIEVSVEKFNFIRVCQLS